MVEDIGGAIDLKHVKIPLFGPTHHPFAYSSVCLARCPEMVMVNTRGERFTNEGDPGDPGRHVGPMEDQPGKIGGLWWTHPRWNCWVISSSGGI